jgi:hypothetical protein
MPDVRGTRISNTSGDSWGGVGAGHWHFPCWYAGAVSPEGPVWAFLPGSARPRCRRCEAPLPIAGRDAEGVVVTR